MFVLSLRKLLLPLNAEHVRHAQHEAGRGMAERVPLRRAADDVPPQGPVVWMEAGGVEPAALGAGELSRRPLVSRRVVPGRARSDAGCDLEARADANGAAAQARAGGGERETQRVHQISGGWAASPAGMVPGGDDGGGTYQKV